MGVALIQMKFSTVNRGALRAVVVTDIDFEALAPPYMQFEKPLFVVLEFLLLELVTTYVLQIM